MEDTRTIEEQLKYLKEEMSKVADGKPFIRITLQDVAPPSVVFYNIPPETVPLILCMTLSTMLAEKIELKAFAKPEGSPKVN